MRSFIIAIVGLFLVSGCFSSSYQSGHNGMPQQTISSTNSVLGNSVEVNTYSHPYWQCMAEKGISTPEEAQAHPYENDVCRRREAAHDASVELSEAPYYVDPCAYGGCYPGNMVVQPVQPRGYIGGRPVY